jgi:hypothetical protein
MTIYSAGYALSCAGYGQETEGFWGRDFNPSHENCSFKRCSALALIIVPGNTKMRWGRSPGLNKPFPAGVSLFAIGRRCSRKYSIPVIR